MTDTTAAVRQHYEAAEASLADRVMHLLDALPEGPLDPAQLAGLDQFHVRGLAATAALAKLADVRAGTAVLDAGSGLGGPARYLAETHGCRVTGVDLTPAFVAVARRLAERTGLADRVDFEVGDLSKLAFADATFDLVWTQHVMMNIRDRAAVYRELHRVLKPDGRFAFYDVLAADDMPPPAFPVPWAESAATSFLLTKDATLAALTQAGFSDVAWHDVTAEALAWFDQPRPPAPQGLSLATVMGPRFAEMSANLARNVREGRLRLVMGVCEAQGR